ncbi:MAG: hypothetical protein Aurels2KO_10540 [Aureliella sp.]
MPGIRKLAIGLFVTMLCTVMPSADAQVCVDGQCQLQPFTLNTLMDVEKIELTNDSVEMAASTVDRYQRVVEATCRVTVSGVCGSGTVVGRDSAGNALVLTNAHVAGTKRERVVQLQRWNTDGTSERGQGAIIASGYGRGLSIDFALLKCNSAFAKNVQPIPLADRYPDTKAGVSTYGCPRCEWPSMQVLSMTRDQGQVLKWKPEAIGGRSGSSIIDYTVSGPRVVGLLTWGGGGEGLGQSTPFLLNAMRGRVPKSFEPLPPGVREVAYRPMPCTTEGEPIEDALLPPLSETIASADSNTVDQIVEDGPDPQPEDDCGLLNRDKDKDKPGRPGIGGRVEAIRETIRFWLIVIGVGAAAWVAGRYLPIPPR